MSDFINHEIGVNPGYMLAIEGWESDRDNDGKQVLDGLSRSDLDFYVDVALRFRRLPYERREEAVPEGHYLGGSELKLDTFIQMMKEMEAKHPDVSEEIKWGWFDIHGEDALYAQDAAIKERLYDLIGMPVYESLRYDLDYYGRAVENIHVYYVPEALPNQAGTIIADLENTTSSPKP